MSLGYVVQRGITLDRSKRETLADLRDLSARIGSDAFLVQANNGNTSVKLDGLLWIKASGQCLARAAKDELHVPLSLEETTACFRNGVEISSGYAAAAVRPSIETAMHVVLHHRVVVHVHSINAIAWATLADGAERLRDVLAGVQWQWIPYTASGTPLALEIERAVKRAPGTDVFVLGNHGLVVCADDCSAAELLLRTVERRLALTPRPVSEPEKRALEVIAPGSKWRLPDEEALHTLATDPISRKILTGGILYPCQAVFLGRTMPLVKTEADFSKLQMLGQTLPFVALEGRGVLLDERIGSAEYATLTALAQVARRIPADGRIRYLTSEELKDVLEHTAGAYKAHGLSGATPIEERVPKALMFDIFSHRHDGDPLWVASVHDFERAKTHTEKLASEKPGLYFIWDRAATQVVTRIDTTFSQSSRRLGNTA